MAVTPFGQPTLNPYSQPIQTILDAIGNTPLIKLEGIWVKLEFMNPSGSIKARIAKYMIEKAEADGRLKPGDTIVEASSGNTGNALSMVAAVKGYKMIVAMPRGMSPERLAMSQAFGAEVMIVGDFHVNDALEVVKRMGQEDGFFSPQQFESEDNIEENQTILGSEILNQLPKGVVPDGLIAGVGTGGTVVGVGKFFKELNPNCKIIAVEPEESCTIMCGEIGKHLMEGISDGFIPGILQRNRPLLDELVAVHCNDAITEMKRLAKTYGLFVGPTSGAHMVASKNLQIKYPELKNIVTFFCDEGEKYINQYFL